MKRPDLIVHGFIALAWVSCCLGIGIKIALLGNEAASAGKQRGADFKTRTELVYQQDRLRAVFEQEACEPAIRQLVRTLDLPLTSPNDRQLPPAVSVVVNRTP
jgi:hypothetical protein